MQHEQRKIIPKRRPCWTFSSPIHYQNWGKSGDAPWAELIGPRQNCPRCPIPRGVDCSYSHPGLNSLCPGTKDFLHRRGQVSVRRWRCRPNTRKMSFPRAELLQRWIVAPTKLLVHQGPGSQVFLDHLLRSSPTGCPPAQIDSPAAPAAAAAASAALCCCELPSSCCGSAAVAPPPQTRGAPSTDSSAAALFFFPPACTRGGGGGGGGGCLRSVCRSVQRSPSGQ